MALQNPGRAHVVAGGFPPGSMAGHDHDYARLRLLGLLAEQGVPASVGNDFADIEKWLPVSRLLITYVAGPYPDAAQCRAIEGWLEAGGHWLALHGTSGGRAERVEGTPQRRTVKTDHHALLGGYFLTHPPICKIRVEVKDPDHPHARAAQLFRCRGRAVFCRTARPGLDADPADRGLRSGCGFAGDWDAIPVGYLSAARRAHSRARLYPPGRRRRCHLLCPRPLPQPSDPRGPSA